MIYLSTMTHLGKRVIELIIIFIVEIVSRKEVHIMICGGKRINLNCEVKNCYNI